jgi:hypothetical protein
MDVRVQVSVASWRKMGLAIDIPDDTPSDEIEARVRAAIKQPGTNITGVFVEDVRVYRDLEIAFVDGHEING